MTTHRLRSIFAALALLALPPTWSLGQAAPRGGEPPAQPTPRQGQIMDISANPILSKLPVTRITLDLDAVAAPQAIRAFKAGDLALSIAAGPYRNMDRQVVTLHLRDAPYMEGLMQLRQQLRAQVREATTAQVTLAYNPNEEIPLWCVAGPFAILYCGISNEVVYPFDLRAGQPAAGGPERRTTLFLDLLAEPGMTVMQSLQDVRCPDLQDDKHQPITLGQPRTTGITSMHPVGLAMVLPEAPGRRIPLLKGTIDARLAQTTPIELPNLLEKQTPPPVEGMAIEISPLEPRPNAPLGRDGTPTFYNLKVQYSRAAMEQARWTQVAPLLPSAKMKVNSVRRSSQISASAPPAGRRGRGAGGADVPPADTLTVTYNVSIPTGAGPAGAAILEIPVGTTDIRVPFEFKDVFLP